MAKELQVVISAQDNASKVFKAVGKESGSFADKIKDNLNTIRVASGAITVGLVAMGKSFVDSAMNAIEQETKLTTVLKQRANATDEQINKIKELTAAQQKLGIVEDDTQIAGLQQLGTFVTQTETLEKLGPAMNNLIAQQKGFNATQGDAINIGNLMGKVLQGQTGALTRVGISFSAAQEEVLKFGTESERAAMLAQVITDNVGNMNEELGNTFQGRMTQLNNTLGDVGETIGMALIPVLQKILEVALPVIQMFADWVTENPNLAAGILGVVAGLSALVLVLSTVGPAIAATVAILMGPAGLVLAIAAVVGGLAILSDRLQTNEQKVNGYQAELIALNAAYAAGELSMEEYQLKLSELTLKINEADAASKTLSGQLSDNFITSLDAIFSPIDSAIQAFENFKIIVNAVGGAFDNLAENIFTTFMTKIQKVVAAVQSAWSSISGLASKAGGAIGKALGIGGERAIGGPMASGTPYLVGERGPEIIVPTGSSSVVPNNQMGGGQTTVNLNMGGVTVTNEADENRLISKITDALNRQSELYQMGIN